MLTLVISLGVGTRFYFLEKHFAHIDDIGVATTILDRQQYMGGVVNRYDKWRLEVLNGKKAVMLTIVQKKHRQDIYLFKINCAWFFQQILVFSKGRCSTFPAWNLFLFI